MTAPPAPPYPKDKQPAIRLVMMPRDTNALGTIFGGVILSHLDLAAAVECRKFGMGRYVTAAMKEVEFVAPVYVGDLVSFYTRTLRVGRTSLTVSVEVEAERRSDGKKVKVTEAEVVYVSVDDNGKPTPVRQ